MKEEKSKRNIYAFSKTTYLLIPTMAFVTTDNLMVTIICWKNASYKLQALLLGLLL